MMNKGKEFLIAAVTLTVLGIGCLAESKHSMGLAMKTDSLLVPGLPSQLKIAQRQNPCKRGSSVAPAQETRKIREEKFQFSFNVPTNYRTEKRQDGKNLTISLHNPADDEFLECCHKNDPIACGYQTLPVFIKVEPATPATPLLPELSVFIKRIEPIVRTSIAKQKAFIYVTKSTMTGKIDADNVETSLSASFLTPDKRNKITISTSKYGEKISAVEEKVFNTVISSFAFVR
ncbi:hypothetical protein QUB68_24575 [Microcoleus sp. A006_D1]|uniref:hypothetical protein n=1 Tax=Microcoleus sp. A006_D1 TaxID=3055267 RepID=UPI002FD6956E